MQAHSEVTEMQPWGIVKFLKLLQAFFLVGKNI